MAALRIYELIIAPDREDHIARHHVEVQEAEEVVFGQPLVARTRQGRYTLIGRTDAGRYLSVITAPRGRGVYGLVTARDSMDAEQRRYEQHRGR